MNKVYLFHMDLTLTDTEIFCNHSNRLSPIHLIKQTKENVLKYFFKFLLPEGGWWAGGKHGLNSLNAMG